MKKIILYSSLLCSLVFQKNISSAQDSTLTIGGRLQYDHISYFDRMSGKINHRNEGLFRFEAGSEIKTSTRWKAITELREDLSDKSRNRIWIDELWMKQKISFIDITLGKQIIAWGSTDGINPVNYINPTDYSDLLDTENEIIGVYGLRTQLFFKSSDVDLFWGPVGSFGKLPGTDSRWFPTIAMFGLPPELIELGITPSFEDRFPEICLKNGETGVRFRKRFSGFDIAFSYYNGYDHLPEFELDTSKLMQAIPELVFDKVYYRQQAAGLETVFALPYGIGLRGEAAWYFPEEKKPKGNQYILAVAGIDKSFAINTVSLNVIVQYIRDFRIDGDAYNLFDTRHLFSNSLMANIDLSLNNGFFFKATTVYNVIGKDILVRPEVNYLTSGGVKFCLLFDLLEGSKDTFFGTYSFNDRIQCKVVFIF
jgi:hypothetical protein